MEPHAWSNIIPWIQDHLGLQVLPEVASPLDLLPHACQPNLHRHPLWCRSRRYHLSLFWNGIYEIMHLTMHGNHKPKPADAKHCKQAELRVPTLMTRMRRKQEIWCQEVSSPMGTASPKCHALAWPMCGACDRHFSCRGTIETWLKQWLMWQFVIL